MPRKGDIRPWPELGEPPRGLTSRARQHFEWLQTQLEPTTCRSRFKELRAFLDWCCERELADPSQLDLDALERYQRHLLGARKKKNDNPLSARTQSLLLNAVRQFCHWLMHHNYILYNPATELTMPRVAKRLPRTVLSPIQVEKVIEQIDVSTPLGLRDRAMVEVLYSTGVRRSELMRLEITDLHVERGTVLVREGKNKRDRIVPIGRRALHWVLKYLREVRPEFAEHNPNTRRLFVGAHGEKLVDEYVGHRLRRYIDATELDVVGMCHLLRHSMATSMLENGADIRFIQEMLGHADLKTTQIYTRVSIQKLQDVHSKTHPAERDQDNNSPTDE